MILYSILILSMGFSVNAMEREEPAFIYTPIEDRESKIRNIESLSLEKLCDLIEKSEETARAADHLNPVLLTTVKNELKSRHLILLYDIFKTLSLPAWVTCSQEKNDHPEGQVYLLNSGFYLNSNPSTQKTKIWNLRKPEEPLVLDGNFTCITQDEKFILLTESYNRVNPMTSTLYEVETGKKIFTCTFDYTSDVLVYDPAANVWEVKKGIGRDYEKLSTLVKKHSPESYLFLAGKDIALFQKFLTNDEFLKALIPTFDLKHRFKLRCDNKYALLWHKIFDLSTMKFLEFSSPFHTAMSSNNSILIAQVNEKPELNVFDLSKLPNETPVTTLQQPNQDCFHIQNIAISPDGKRAIIAFYEKGGNPSHYHHLRKYVLYDTRTGAHSTLHRGDFIDLQEITSYKTEYITFDNDEKLLIARDNVYCYDFLKSIPDLTLVQISFLIQLSKQSKEYCATNNHKLSQYIYNEFKDAAIREAILHRFDLN